MERSKGGIVIKMGLMFCLSLLTVSAVAIPASRSFNSLTPPLSIQELCAQGKVDWRVCNVVVWEEEGIAERRVLVETDDYSGPGSNPDHDPIPPPATP